MLTKGARPIVDAGSFKFPYDQFTIGAFDNIMLFAVGAAVSLLTARPSLGYPSGPVVGLLMPAHSSARAFFTPSRASARPTVAFTRSSIVCGLP